MGPQIEYAAQDPAGPVELRIYRGANGKFDLYEDGGDGYEYEKGQHSVIPIRWDDRSSSLTIGPREGSFPGMIESRKFRVVLVAEGHAVGVDGSGVPNAEISYQGKEVQVTIK
jgi:alpha-D-xyloside xylohydrolase